MYRWTQGFSGGSVVRSPPANAGLIPGSRRSPGEGNGTPLQGTEEPGGLQSMRVTKESDTTEQLSTHTHTDGHNLFKQTRLWVTPDPVTCVQATYIGGGRRRKPVHGLKDICSQDGQTGQQVVLRTTLQAFYASNFIWFLISQFTILCAAPWSLFAGRRYHE